MYFDFIKAFDTILHDILLNKLMNYDLDTITMAKYRQKTQS